MKKLTVIVMLTLLSSCESKMDKCIKEYVDEKGYSYEDACEICKEMEEDSYR